MRHAPFRVRRWLPSERSQAIAALGAAGRELELSLAELTTGLACAHGAIIYGQLDVAALRLDLAGGAPNDSFKHGMQCDSLHGFPDDTLDLLVSDLSEVRFLVGDGCLQLDRIRHPLGHVLFDSLQPAAVLVSQPERDASGMQIMLRRVEVDSSQLLGCGSLGNLAQGFGAMAGPIAKRRPPFPHTVRQLPMRSLAQCLDKDRFGSGL